MQLELIGLSAGMTVVSAPRLDALFEHLGDVLVRDPLPPFERELIVVAENRGLGPWLEQKLADRLGCAAGMAVLPPQGLADMLIRRHVSGQKVQRDPFDRQSLTWRVEALLESWPEDDARIAPLRAYVERSEGGRVALAERIARLFEEYQTYRPELLSAWARGENPLGYWEPSRWQAVLWRRLNEGVRADDGPPASDRGGRLEALIKWLDRLDAPPAGLPPRLSVFGALLLPPPQVRMIRALARVVPVTWYAVLPGATRGHPLWRLLGEQEETFEQMILGDGDISHKSIGEDVDGGGTVLRVVQGDVRWGKVRSGDDRVHLDASDASLRFHACHGAVRELEVLRDQLLDAFATIDGLRPEHVAVFLADPGRYAPLVDAVFGDASEMPSIPYQVLSRGRSGGQRLVEAFGRLLALADSRVTASQVLDLLDEPAVRRRARIDEAELTAVRDWVRQANIRWGEDGLHKARFGLPGDDLHTWLHGLDRLMMGYAMGDEAEPVQDVIPLGEPLLDRADLLGRFCRWLVDLLDDLRSLRRDRTLAEWSNRLARLITDHLEADDEPEIDAVRFLHEQIGGLAEVADFIPNRGPIAFTDVQHVLTHQIERYTGDGGRLAGRVTFTDFEHLRYAPFRVIAAVGLNDGVFPRSSDLPNFDARAREPQAGDHDPRQLDRQLFLDAFLTAEDRFIITYTGRSQKDNSERAPSVVIDALLDTCRHTFTSARDVTKELVVEHALQPFSPRYFDGEDPRLYSFDARQCLQPVARRENIAPFAYGALDLPAAENGIVELTLHDLVEAWVNPSVYFCRQIGVSFDLDDVTLNDAEPIRLDGLERYKVRDELLRLVLSGMGETEAARRMNRAGLLPGGALGEGWFRQISRDAKKVAERVRKFGEGEAVECEIDGGAWRVSGRVQHVVDSTAVFYRCASVKVKDQLRAWVAHLALHADAEQPFETVVIGTDTTYSFRPVEAGRDLLQALVEGALEIRSRPVPLFTLASAAYMPGRSWYAARGVFRDAYQRTADFDDPHVRLCFRHADPIAEQDPDFDRWAALLWEPLLEHRDDG